MSENSSIYWIVGFNKYANSAVILSGATENAAGIDLQGSQLCGLFIPPEFDGTTITFKASITLTGTYVPVQAGGVIYTLTTAASNYVPIENLAVFSGLNYIKIVCGTTQSSTNTTITLAVRPVS